MQSVAAYKNPIVGIISGSNIGQGEIITNETYGKCGVLTACLTDPLSRLISKICGLKDDDVNSVGFYYEGELHGVMKTTVILFNIYDNDPIQWLRLGSTMDLILSSPFVTKIIYYPLASNNDGSLLNRNNIKYRNNYSKIEEKFRASVVQILGYNSKIRHDKNISYTALLLKALGITGNGYDNLVNGMITGYTLVNKVLLNLMGVENRSSEKISSSIIHSPLFQRPICITAPREKNNDMDIQYIVEESRREITKLAAVFIDLYTSNEEFRENIINKRIGGTTSTNIDVLLAREMEYINYITGGLQNGTISTATINEIIEDINKEREKLGCKEKLPLILSYRKNVEITDELAMCTFKIDNNAGSSCHEVVTNITSSKSDGIKNLGDYIQYLVDTFQTDDVLNISLGSLISNYNEIIKGTELEEIKLPNKLDVTMSKSAIVTIPGNNESINLVMKNIVIPMHGANLVKLSEAQLMDILVYLDSLKSNDGCDDTRYTNLQNEVTYELARRNNKSKGRKY